MQVVTEVTLNLKHYHLKHFAATWGTKVTISKVGCFDLDNDHSNLISCKQVSIDLSNLQTKLQYLVPLSLILCYQSIQIYDDRQM